jgi:hypothetical protein
VSSNKFSSASFILDLKIEQTLKKLLAKPKKSTAVALNLLGEVYGEDGKVT